MQLLLLIYKNNKDFILSFHKYNMHNLNNYKSLD